MKKIWFLTIIVACFVLFVPLHSSLAITSVGLLEDPQVTNLLVEDNPVVSPTEVIYVCTETPRFKGYSVASGSIDFKIKSEETTGTAWTDGSGYFEWISPALADGEHEVYMTVMDSEDNKSNEFKVATIDTGCSLYLTPRYKILWWLLILLLLIIIFLIIFLIWRRRRKKDEEEEEERISSTDQGTPLKN